MTHTALVHLRHPGENDEALPLERRADSGAHDAKQPDNTVHHRVARAAVVVQGTEY